MIRLSADDHKAAIAFLRLGINLECFAQPHASGRQQTEQQPVGLAEAVRLRSASAISASFNGKRLWASSRFGMMELNGLNLNRLHG